MKIAVDFDGTIVEHRYPSIGKERPFAVETLKLLAAEGHQLILWTVRSGKELDEAVSWCRDRGLTFYAVNSNTPASVFAVRRESLSPKVVADVYIDDRNIGGIPDWGEVYRLISDVDVQCADNDRKSRHWFRYFRGVIPSRHRK